MMKQKIRQSSSVFLILGIAFFAIGLSTDNKTFTWIAITFMVISLLAGGKWLRPRRK